MMSEERYDFSSDLNRFNAVSLDDMQNVALQDRIDTKYVFTIDRFASLLEQLTADYLILEINNIRTHRYHTLYYDTPGFDCYYNHLRGILNRYKIRLRTYADTGISYFEVKFKSNKGRTIKTRILLTNVGEVNTEAKNIVTNQTPYSFSDLQQKFWVNFNRITLISKDYKERLTFDIGLTYVHDDEELHNDEFVIAELKQNKSSISVFRNLMKQNHIRKSSLSKYCYGVVQLIKDVKKNNFKELVHSLNKKIYGISTGY